MDHDTLVNHIRGLSKVLFDGACNIVLRDFFNIIAINVDGKNDGGADFIEVGADGARSDAVYQLTTQKEKVPEKLGRDVVKSIEKLSAKRFYFFTSTNVSEIECRRYESEYSKALDIQVYFFSARHIAEFLLHRDLLNRFIDAVNYPLPRSFNGTADYKEMALHGYTIMSDDAQGMRTGVYDDTILFVLSDGGELQEPELISRVLRFLKLDSDKEESLKRRIGALFSKKSLHRMETGAVGLSQGSMQDIQTRKRIYEQELSDLAAVQIDIMRKDFKVDWTESQSKDVSIYIADAYIGQQMDLLSDIKAKVNVEPIFNQRARDQNSIREYIREKSGLPKAKAAQAAIALLESASNHPLIVKLARASVYVALEGRSAVASANALGASRWSDFNILIEPSVAIHWICSRLYDGDINGFFNISKKAVQRAISLNTTPLMPYFYINECASHLLVARKYSLLEDSASPEELQYSRNAFIANYYALKAKGVRVPNTIIEYLKTFSSAVLIERPVWKDWVRAVMIDVQSILSKSGVQFVDVPFYKSEDCSVFEREYTNYLTSRGQNKSRYLMDHDIWALQFTHNEVVGNNAHWAVLTFDNVMIKVGAAAAYAGWIVTPYKFLDITASSRSLSDTQYVSLVHSLAVSSEKTLSIAARIIDRVVNYASDQLQNWEFKTDFESFKQNLLSEFDGDDTSREDEELRVDSKVDEFLRAKGIDISEEE